MDPGLRALYREIFSQYADYKHGHRYWIAVHSEWRRGMEGGGYHIQKVNVYKGERIESTVASNVEFTLGNFVARLNTFATELSYHTYTYESIMKGDLGRRAEKNASGNLKHDGGHE